MNKMDGGAVPQFPSPGNPEQVYTCGHMHCYEKGTRLIDLLHVYFYHVLFFIFETKLFLYNLPVTWRALALNP